MRFTVLFLVALVALVDARLVGRKIDNNKKVVRNLDQSNNYGGSNYQQNQNNNYNGNYNNNNGNGGGYGSNGNVYYSNNQNNGNANSR